MCQLCPNSSEDLFCVDCLKLADHKAADHFIPASDLNTGLLIVCDGGALDNQSEDRYGYGSMRVLRNGKPVASTYMGAKKQAHTFDYGLGVTNSVAEVRTMQHALLYAKELVERGWKHNLRIGCDSRNALLAATTRIKKPAPHLKVLYGEIHNLALELREQVQFVKLNDQDVKRILGH
jgi:ribonuclease HI